MTFSSDVREEIAHQTSDRACCRVAFLGAVLRGAGSLHLTGGGHVHGEIDVAGHAVGRQLLQILRAEGASCEIRTYRPTRLPSAQRVLIVFAEDPATSAVLQRTGVVNGSGWPLPADGGALAARPCCRVAALRGAFVAGGSVAGPGRAPAIEIRTHDAAFAEVLARCAEALEIPVRVRQRERWSEVMTRRREGVQDLLTVLGAKAAALDIAEDEVVRSARSDANRQANFDTANLGRQVVAARRQLQAISRLMAADALARLPPELRDAAHVRADNPELTLAELAEAAGVARPTLAGRLRRLVAAGDETMEAGEDRRPPA